VREHVERGESIYAVDRESLEELSPDLILTQDLCHVCAATPDELGAALAHISNRPEVLSLDPRDLGDVWRDILWIGECTGRRERAQRLVERIGARLAQIEEDAGPAERRPRVVVLEWRPLGSGDGVSRRWSQCSRGSQETVLPCQHGGDCWGSAGIFVHRAVRV